VSRAVLSQRRGLSSSAAAVARKMYERHVVADEMVEGNGGLLEYSVVYTDRALNHMSEPFMGVMKDLHESLTAAYKADAAVLVPGSGTYAMEGAARAFASDGPAVVVRNGYFSYRWSQILATMGKPESEVHVLRARPPAEKVCGCEPHCGNWSKLEERPCFAPPPIEEVVAKILETRPRFVAAPHVETSAGIVLPEAYLKEMARASREVGAVFCVDGVASGTAWLDMRDIGIDCYVTAPQKGWSGPAAVGVAMLSERAEARLAETKPTSFVVDLAKWRDVYKAYLGGGHMYHATMPTDAIRLFRDVVHETERFGLDAAEAACWELGAKIRAVLADRGFRSVAAEGFHAPGVAVVHAPSADFAARFKAHASLQIAAGVPLMVGEPDDYQSFRIGLFGLDKLMNVDLTVHNFATALDAVHP